MIFAQLLETVNIQVLQERTLLVQFALLSVCLLHPCNSVLFNAIKTTYTTTVSPAKSALVPVASGSAGGFNSDFNDLCMATAYHQLNNPSLLSFYEPQTYALLLSLRLNIKQTICVSAA